MNQETEKKKKTNWERDTLSKKGEWNKNKKKDFTFWVKHFSHIKLYISAHSWFGSMVIT